MPKITIDGQSIECRDHIPVLQAALEAGAEIPHYCYHPGLTVVASCRLCLMEMKMAHPKTGELSWAPKLFPSCQTPVKDGMEVRFKSPAVEGNTRHTMEYYLLNHPLDCPVCDKAGECYLQDYSEQFGNASSRMIEDKHKNPKKDIGSHTLLYQDRCVLCSRCVRFCEEVAGTAELAVVDRGNRSEIDVFPGLPLENKLQGNVVDLCPVGALLDKDFLFKQRVWELRGHDSVCPGCSRGCTTVVDEAKDQVKRIRPRYNEKVNEWWTCDEGRFGWHYVHRPDRLNQPRVRRGAAWEALRWEDLPAILKLRLGQAAGSDNGSAVAAVLSPMMTCEEAWLLARFVRSAAAQATLVCGPVPRIGRDETFRKGFVIKSDKCPNEAGIRRIIQALAGPTLDFAAFVDAAGRGRFKAAYVYGGYARDWVSPEAAQAAAKIEFLAIHDLFRTALQDVATIEIPAAAWVEREGTFVNHEGLVQAFERAIRPPPGVKFDGQFFQELAEEPGLYRARKVREKMAGVMAEFQHPFEPRRLPAAAH